jgi:uncharacterized membrane protein YfcA
MINGKEKQLLSPFLIRLDKLQILLVGAGDAGHERLQVLLNEAPGARVVVVAPTVSEKVERLLASYPSCSLLQRPFLEADLEEKDLVILATNNETLHRQISVLASSKGQTVHMDQSGRLINSEESGNRWRKIAIYSFLAFALMLIGHFIFSYLPLREIADSTYAWYQVSGDQFLIILVAGFVAQLVDGALGMGYGVTSATILLSAGVSPAAMSGSIHTAEMFASGASGYTHYKFGNVNRKLFKALVIPGVLGAIAGAVLLVVAGERYSSIIRPCIAAYTLVLGIKFIVTAIRGVRKQKKFKRYRLLAAAGGFFDSFGGGGWGPIVTSTLINNGRSHKYVVGSVSLTEFFVTLSSAFTFFTMIGVSHWQTIIALVIGGLLAAPLAALLAGRLPRRLSFILLGALVIFWSIRILIKLI